MNPHPDILKQIADCCVRSVQSLPESLFTFPLRAAWSLGLATMGTAVAFNIGSRQALIQICTGVIAAFAALLCPIEDVSDWLRRTNRTLAALFFAVAFLLMLILPRFLPRFLVPQFDAQQRTSKLLYWSLGALFAMNIATSLLHHIRANH